MTSKLNLTFDPGAPIDATKLMQLVNYINELEATTLKLTSDVAGISNQNASKRMDSGIKELGNISFSGAAIPFEISFNGTLITAPSAVVATIECSNTDADIVHYISNVSATGFRLYLNRVAGIKDKSTTVSQAVYSNVKVHYVAFAKLEV